MKAGRNDPCPCGSGRKYKACCMAADRVEERVREISPQAFMMAERHAHETAREVAEWCVDVVPVDIELSDDAGSLPALYLVTADGFVVHGGLLPQRPAGLPARAKAFAEAVRNTAQVVGAFPRRVRVREADVALRLSDELRDRGITADAGDLHDLDAAMDEALGNLKGDPIAAKVTHHLSWTETDATPAEVEALHHAAVDYYTESVWDEVMEPLVLTWPDGSEWAMSTMGSGGEQYGLVLHSVPDDLASLYDADTDNDAGQFFGSMRGLALTAGFDRGSDLTRELRREVAKAGWPVASPDAYLHLYGVSLPERRITSGHVRQMTQAFRAVTLYARGEDPVGETGIQLRPLLDGDGPTIPDLSKLPTPWPVLETAVPSAAVGPGAGLAEAVESQWEPDAAHAEEDARLERFRRWLSRKKLSKAARSAALRNGQCWRDYLHAQRISAGAVTEFDLRVFAYLFYPRGASTTRAAARALPKSLDLLFEFLETKEKIAYPQGIQIVGELERWKERSKEMGAELDEGLDLLAELVIPYLEYRGLLPMDDVPGNRQWPSEETRVLMLQLTREIQRRWLLWYEEIAVSGMHRTEEVRPILVARQREWETAPHPKLDGKSPRQVAEMYPGKEDDDGSP